MTEVEKEEYVPPDITITKEMFKQIEDAAMKIIGLPEDARWIVEDYLINHLYDKYYYKEL